MGDPTKTVTVGPGANLGIWANTNLLDKVLTLNGGTLYNGGWSNNFAGPITLLSSSNTIQLDTDLHLWGPIGGTGGFIKAGSSNLWLEGTNTYSGPTTIGANSTVMVGTNSSLGSSSTIEIDGGSTLDVSQPSAFNLGSGQTMIGNGTVVGGNIYFGSGSTLAVSFSGYTSTLTMSGNLAFLTGSTNYVKVNKTTGIANDKVTGLSSVTMGGALVITNIGNALAGGDAIPLFSASSYSGSFSSIVPSTPGPGLAWNTNTRASDGT
jgi:fibronectin-binding autotransporter adhesin